MKKILFLICFFISFNNALAVLPPVDNLNIKVPTFSADLKFNKLFYSGQRLEFYTFSKQESESFSLQKVIYLNNDFINSSRLGLVGVVQISKNFQAILVTQYNSEEQYMWFVTYNNDWVLLNSVLVYAGTNDNSYLITSYMKPDKSIRINEISIEYQNDNNDGSENDSIDENVFSEPTQNTVIYYAKIFENGSIIGDKRQVNFKD